MTKIRLQFVHEFRDRHGKIRRYFRRPGFKRVPLPGVPGSAEFMAAYQAALVGETAPRLDVGARRTVAGTVAALTVLYFNSPEFRSLSASTQATYRGIIERFRAEHGEKRVALLGREHITKMLGGKTGTPAAANNWLRMVRMLMQFAVAEGLRKDNPTLGLKGLKIRSDGFVIWGEDHITAFRDRHALGTRARLALELLLSTAQRRGDIVRLGRQHIRDGILSVRQQKTGTLVEIPVLPELQAALEATTSEHLTFLTTDFGKPFSPAGFGNWFHDMCSEAGLPKGYAAHGLRKAAATRLADVGCSDHEIMAWGGWKTLKEVQRYTKAANRKRLARSGADKLAGRTSSGKPS